MPFNCHPIMHAYNQNYSERFDSIITYNMKNFGDKLWKIGALNTVGLVEKYISRLDIYTEEGK